MATLQTAAQSAKKEIQGVGVLQAVVVVGLCGVGAAIPVLHYVTHVPTWTKIEAILALGFITAGLLVLIPNTLIEVIKDFPFPWRKKNGSTN